LLPPLSTQRKIAGVLSAYDDLIENNSRRIAILEEMAQAIYREWFVNFRFPGRENVKLIYSPLGKIPEGWRVAKLEDAVYVNPRVTVPKNGEKFFVSMGAIPHNTMLIDVSALERRTGNSGAKFQNADTLFARITPCLENGKTAFVQFLNSSLDVAFGSTEFIVLRSKTVCPEFVYLLARSDPFRDNAIKSMSGATGRQRVQEKCFDKFFIAHPDSTTLSDFSAVMQPLFRHVFMLDLKNCNLRQTRDLLLPKLISGQLDVEDLDIDIGEPPVEATT
jgi:type I restriction enzyme S subunit